MFSVQMFDKWFCVCVLLASNWSWWFADGSCLYPGHRSNENVQFTPIAQGHIYSTGTIAMYYCESESIKDRFKELECQESGTWVWRWGKENPQSCALTIVNRCQRPLPAGINAPLRTLIIENTCVNLHLGLIDAAKMNIEITCNTGMFQTSEAKRLGAVYYSMDEKKSICKMFEFSKSPSASSGFMLFLTRTTQLTWPNVPAPTDKKWLQDFAGALRTNGENPSYPRCPYLQCHPNGNPALYIINSCEIRQRYWICRHEISSCGIPTQRKNTLMAYSGIYVGNVASYRCYDGYITGDNLTRECHSNGLWFGEAPKCEPINCETPSPNENVTFELTNDSTTLGSKLNYTCKWPGHSMNGFQYRTCHADGKWHGEEPICLSTNNEALTSSQSGLNSEEMDLLKLIIGAVAGVTVFLIALMWLVLAAILYRDKQKQQSRSGELQMKTH